MTALSDSPTVIILAAGRGKRFHSSRPKVLHEVAGRAMLGHILAAVAELNARPVVVVPAADPKTLNVGDWLAANFPQVETVVQASPGGTGDAVACCRDALTAGAGARVLVVPGDAPLLRPETLAAVLSGGDELTLLGFRTDAPTGYGRILLDDTGQPGRIAEEHEASDEERATTLCNSGVLSISGRCLTELVDQVEAGASGERYLTDILMAHRTAGGICRLVECEAAEALGVNDRTALSRAEAFMQDRLRHNAMTAGATLIDPASIFLSHDTVLARDVVVGPNVVFGPGVQIGEGSRIEAFCHLEGAVVGEDCRIGPFARLRPGSETGRDVRIGNFVETKNARIEPGVRVNHLTYAGDADIGAGSNIGAGTITCNYDGAEKHRTEIGKGSFIGSNVSLVAPVRIGDGACIGAGSVVTADVAPGTLALTRAERRDRPWKRKAKD